MVTYTFGTTTPQIISYTGGKGRVLKKRKHRSGSKKKSAAAALRSLRAKEAAVKAAAAKVIAERARQDEIRRRQEKARKAKADIIRNNLILKIAQKTNFNNIINRLVLDNKAKKFDARTAIRVKRDIANGNLSRAWSVIVDNVTGGSISQGNINEQQKNLNKATARFNNKWRGNNTLSGDDYTSALNERDALISGQKRIDNKNQALSNNKIKKILNIENIPRFDVLGLVPLNLSSQLDPVYPINIIEIESPANGTTPISGGMRITVSPSPPTPISPRSGSSTRTATLPVVPPVGPILSPPTSPTNTYSSSVEEVVGITRYGKLYPILSKVSLQSSVSLSSPITTYAIVIRRNDKQVRMRTLPLSLNVAKDLLAFVLDNSLARTGKIVRVGVKRRVARIPMVIKGYYKKNEKKFKVVRTKGGLVITLIEKRKYAGDTRGEVRQLQMARKKKATKKKVVKRKPIKRKKMIKKKVVKRKTIKRKKIVKKKRKN